MNKEENFQRIERGKNEIKMNLKKNNHGATQKNKKKQKKKCSSEKFTAYSSL
jgi:hypothetical protein